MISPTASLGKILQGRINCSVHSGKWPYSLVIPNVLLMFLANRIGKDRGTLLLSAIGELENQRTGPESLIWDALGEGWRLRKIFAFKSEIRLKLKTEMQMNTNGKSFGQIEVQLLDPPVLRLLLVSPLNHVKGIWKRFVQKQSRLLGQFWSLKCPR